MSEVVESVDKRISQSSKQAFRNPWVLGWIAMVVIVLGANVGMITTAMVTNPGLVAKDYYEKGKAYEENVIKRRAARSQLGWAMELEAPQKTVMANPAPYFFRVTDAAGNPLSGASVRLFAYRPADAAADFDVPMSEVGDGLYNADVTFPLKGIWDVIVYVQHEGNDYNYPRRISVKAQ